jgi:hypothetical protein
VYQAITTVSLGDGATTYFWFDVWWGEDSLADRFPALLTHCTVSSLTVREAVMGGIRGCLVSRLTQTACDELHALEEIVADTVLTSDADARLSPLLLPDGRLHSSMLY